jgi:hypothetical protein
MSKYHHTGIGHGSFGGIILVIIGTLALVNIYYHISAPVWPCIVIAVGVLLIFKKQNFRRNRTEKI